MLCLHDLKSHLRIIDLAVELSPIKRILPIGIDEDEWLFEAFVLDGSVDWSIEAKTADDAWVALDCDCCC